MKALEAAVVSLYEGGATVDQIAEAEGLERAIVITILTARVPEFTDAQTPGPTEVVDKMISDRELDMMFEAYKNLQYDENSVIREKVLKNCINMKMKVSDGLGKDDPKKIAKLMAKEIGKHANIMLLNDMLRKSRENRQLEVMSPHDDQKDSLDIQAEVVNQ